MNDAFDRREFTNWECMVMLHAAERLAGRDTCLDHPHEQVPRPDTPICQSGHDIALISLVATKECTTTLSPVDIELFNHDVSSLRLAMERGAVSMVHSKLYDLPAFIPWAMCAGEETKTAILGAIDWLEAAKTFEALHGLGSKKDPDHWLNISIERNLREYSERIHYCASTSP